MLFYFNIILLLLSISKRVSSFSGPSSKWDLNVAIVGAGPSGLLAAHRLVQSQLPINNLDIYESRSDPRDKQTLGGRAYALGLGMRGRTAIRTVDEELWSAVKKKGYECERFRLHFNSKFNIKLRDKEDGVEPSLLIYQSDLCVQLLDELESRCADTNMLNVYFDSKISKVDLDASTISINDDKDIDTGPYDLIVGCDGANSIIRKSLLKYSPPNTFSFTQRKLLPGCFKVARTEEMPPLLDSTSVGLILPQSKSLGITAFVEPTVGGSSCILFAGKLSNETTTTAVSSDIDGNDDTDLGSILFPHPDSINEEGLKLDIGTITNLILEQFPLLEGTPGMDDVVKQLLSQRTAVADSIKCNIYHSNSDITPTAICGDAAHATGGVSGQGCNSALMDTAVLADCLEKYYQPTKDSDDIQKAKQDMLYKSISSYSKKAVPEGHALYDLSFGNDGKTLPILRNIRALISNGMDTIFGGRFGIGKKPLQTLLASSLTSFVDIRRDREKYYAEEFHTDKCYRQELEGLYRVRGKK